MFIFWGIIIGLGVGFNILCFLLARELTQHQYHPEGPAGSYPPSFLGRSLTQIRAHLLLPATFRKSCAVAHWYGTIPPRIETLIITIFVIINVVLCAVRYEAFDRNVYYPLKTDQLWRLIADRTGYISYANLAIFWLFGIRNNVLIWLTRWEFATFNRFHRWVARVATLQAILHSVAYTVFTYCEQALAESFKEQYW